MNLKDRGITVGDLVLIIIFIFSTVFIINKVKENEKQVYFLMTPNEVLTVKES